MSSSLDTAIDIAREAGAILSHFASEGVQFELKSDFDLVTKADRASEKLVVERLRQHFPAHDVIAEEGGGHLTNSDYRWYVDPLDGTTNFAHGFPVYNVTLALEQAGTLLLGVIYDPTRDELFAAERGSGAYLNGRRIQVSATQDLESALVATGFPSRKRHQNINVHFYHQMAMLTHGVRRAGSAAIDLAYVACGRLEAFWEFNLQPWDMAAGILMVQEAGGLCSDMEGKPADLRGPHLLADNRLLHEPIVTLFGEIFDGNMRVPMPSIESRQV